MSANNNGTYDGINMKAKNRNDKSTGYDFNGKIQPENNSELINDLEQNNYTDLKDKTKTQDTQLKTDTESASENADELRKKRKKFLLKSLWFLCTTGFVVFSLLFINEILIQPYKLKQSIKKARELYNSSDEGENHGLTDCGNKNNLVGTDIKPDNDINEESTKNEPGPVSGRNAEQKDPNRDEMGRLLKFSKLLEINEDVKGWIRIDNIKNGENDTKINYVVVQSGPEKPEFYLTRDWATKTYLKAGSIFLDYTCLVNIENTSKNLIIHGHNMTSSDDIFHYLINYKELKFLK